MSVVAGTALILNLAGAALIHALRRTRYLPSFVLRQGAGSLYRPGNQTWVILSAVGLGALFLITVRLQQVKAPLRSLHGSAAATEKSYVKAKADRRRNSRD